MSAEYVDDVPYLRHFIADLAPSRLRLAAALNGFAPPPAEDFDYCELGSAHGDTLAALAASCPESRFLGIDIVGSHVASARRLARDVALENVGFLERDFGDLVHEDVGEFDYVVAHGVVSWVSPEKRQALVDFARAKLKPGGLLFVSYNALPGWASVEPLRQLLLSPPANGASTLERARRGVDFADAMQRAGAEYFSKNPAAAEMLATMKRAGLPYVVHEYLHEHWVPLYFARVAWEMAQSDLHYVGSLPAHANFRDASIPEAIEPVLAHVDDRVTFESLKDFAINEFFRRDVFIKGEVDRSDGTTHRYLDETRWTTLAGAFAERTVQLPHRTIDLGGATFDALEAAFAEGPATIAELATRHTIANLAISVGELRRAILRLLVTEQLVPLRAPARTFDARGRAFVVPSTYNQTMLRRASSDVPLCLASTVAGTAFPISSVDALAIRVFTEAAPPERAARVESLVGNDAQRKAVLQTIAGLEASRLPKLVELGVLARAPGQA